MRSIVWVNPCVYSVILIPGSLILTRGLRARWVILKNKYVSLPIKETPVLRGKDADRFLAAMEKSNTKKVPQSELARAKKVYEALNKKGVEDED